MKSFLICNMCVPLLNAQMFEPIHCRLAAKTGPSSMLQLYDLYRGSQRMLAPLAEEGPKLIPRERLSLLHPFCAFRRRLSKWRRLLLALSQPVDRLFHCPLHHEAVESGLPLLKKYSHCFTLAMHTTRPSPASMETPDHRRHHLIAIIVFIAIVASSPSLAS